MATKAQKSKAAKKVATKPVAKTAAPRVTRGQDQGKLAAFVEWYNDEVGEVNLKPEHVNAVRSNFKRFQKSDAHAAYVAGKAEERQAARQARIDERTAKQEERAERQAERAKAREDKAAARKTAAKDSGKRQAGKGTKGKTAAAASVSRKTTKVAKAKAGAKSKGKGKREPF